MVIPLIATMLAFQANDVKVYESKQTDLKFSYPADWKLKKDRLYDEFSFNVEGKPVTVQVMVTQMNYPKDHWQTVNREVNENNYRQVLKQWEEELLGVPLLLLRVRDTAKAEPQIIVTGLLYSNRNDKMLFRLNANESVAAQAENIWTNVLLSSNTISGVLPSEANGGTTTTVPVNTNGGEANVSVITPPTHKPDKTVRGESRVKVDGSSGLIMYHPATWTYKDDVLVRETVKVKVSHGIGDERIARSAWLKVCGGALNRINAVVSRTETEPKYTKAGMRGSTLNRVGAAGDYEEYQWVVYGWSAGYYFVLEWSGTPADYEKTKDALAELYQLTAVAPE